jgi:hypothetical protein
MTSRRACDDGGSIGETGSGAGHEGSVIVATQEAAIHRPILPDPMDARADPGP